MPIDPNTLAEARRLVHAFGMGNFVPKSAAPAGSGELLLPIELIDPPVRGKGVPNFNKPDPDRPGVVRSSSILAAIRDDVALPPLLVYRREGHQRYELRDGFHRLHMAAALGFTHVHADLASWVPGSFVPTL
ncbi:ParB/Srx family N-terminal domain-containing protein [Hylemonella sp. W303a]|uniref:ParB/Srx family N-terminal domain-containing protein n=1 Tax=Hylemonella sp. W303a TaxID=3389873 RepID=UPI00396B4111